LEREKLIGIVEALIFASEKPLRIEDIRKVLTDASPKEIREAVEDLKKIYDEGSGGIFIAEVARGFQFRTRSEFAPFVKQLFETRPKKISRAAMETLSIIAYRQPIIRSDIERIRGVDCGGVVKMLLDRKLIKILGKKDVVGKPLIYGTTQEFLETFGLKDIKSLPTLKETGELFSEGEIEEQKEFLFSDEEDKA
jgi:segregation and condensation protein B